MGDLTIFHNQACSHSRHAMGALGEAGIDAEVVKYLETPPDRATLEHLISILDEPVADLVRRDDHFRELGLSGEGLDDPARVVDLLLEHPRLMQRPILVRGGRAIIGRSPEKVAAFLEPAGG